MRKRNVMLTIGLLAASTGVLCSCRQAYDGTGRIPSPSALAHVPGEEGHDEVLALCDEVAALLEQEAYDKIDLRWSRASDDERLLIAMAVGNGYLRRTAYGDHVDVIWFSRFAEKLLTCPRVDEVWTIALFLRIYASNEPLLIGDTALMLLQPGQEISIEQRLEEAAVAYECLRWLSAGELSLPEADYARGTDGSAISKRLDSFDAWWRKARVDVDTLAERVRQKRRADFERWRRRYEGKSRVPHW